MMTVKAEKRASASSTVRWSFSTPPHTVKVCVKCVQTTTSSSPEAPAATPLAAAAAQRFHSASSHAAAQQLSEINLLAASASAKACSRRPSACRTQVLQVHVETTDLAAHRRW